MITILQKEDTRLRNISKLVPLAEIGSKKIQRIIADMKEAMYGEDDAVAIAAPQIGVLLRIFVVSGRVLAHPRGKTQTEPQYHASGYRAQHETAQKQNEKLPPDLVFINPELLKRSKKERWAEEGCLSVRWLYGEVKRSEKTTVRAYDENGKLFTRGASGILAQVFQHEIEHLDGKLFIDKARNIQNIPPEKLKSKNT